MKFILLIGLILVGVLVFVFTTSSSAFTISKNTNVVIKPNATEPEKYAAGEFVKYIEKITGNTLNIITEDKHDNVASF